MQMSNYSFQFIIIHWTSATIPWYSSISASPSSPRPRTPSPYSVIAIKAKCVCQALFQRVTHKKVRSNSSQQGVPEMHTGLAPTKTPVCHLWYQSGTLDWRTCQNIVILPFSVQPWTWGCCRYLYRLVMTCSKNYLLPTHRFAVITHAWTWAVVHHIDACIYHTSVFHHVLTFWIRAYPTCSCVLHWSPSSKHEAQQWALGSGSSGALWWWGLSHGGIQWTKKQSL